MDVVRDGELVGASLGGSPVAFAVLVTRHRERARRVAGRLLRDPQEAEDVAQEALLQAYVGLGALRDRDRFGSWLAAIAANLARMRLRRRAHTPVPMAELDGRAAAGDLAEGSALLELVQAAIEALPPTEREAVLACDVLGLSREEAAVLLGCSSGAVRVRLHRARGRLREQLRDHVPLTMPPRREREMIEMDVRDVVTRAGENGGAAATPQGAVPVVVLAEKQGERVLPIWIGAPEAGALVLQIAGEETPRPMSADLMARLVEALGGRVERVIVSSLREKTFFASIALSGTGGPVQVDARPSDALNLARRLGAPIYVDETVLDEAGIRGDELEEKLDREEKGVMGKPGEGAWRSLTAENVRGWWRMPQAEKE
jgi:RNA polymerase sigma factor (sigma-70 family)